MKTIILAAVLTVTAGFARASLPLGRGEVSASLAGTATYDSNVLGAHDATADYFGTLAPRLMYVRKAGEIEASANAGISLIRYLDQTQLNADNVQADATLRIDESNIRNYTGLLSAAYLEDSTIDPDLNTRINSKTASFIGRTALVTGPRSDMALSGTYTDARHSVGSNQQILTTEALYDYKNFFMGNSLRLVGAYDTLHSSGENSLGVPLDQRSYMLSTGLGRAVFHDTVRAGISYGYRILERSAAETSNGQVRQDGAVVSATLEGPFLPEQYFPKVKSSFALIYQQANTPGINDVGGTTELTGKLGLAWDARTNTKVTFTAERNQRLSVNDLSVVSTNVQLGLQQVLRHNLTGRLNAGYEWSSYRPLSRRDEIATFGARLEYHFSRSWDTDLSYVLTSATSTVRQSVFDRHVASLTVTYLF